MLLSPSPSLMHGTYGHAAITVTIPYARYVWTCCYHRHHPLCTVRMDMLLSLSPSPTHSPYPRPLCMVCMDTLLPPILYAQYVWTRCYQSPSPAPTRGLYGLYGHAAVTATFPYARSTRTRSCPCRPRRLYRVRRDTSPPLAIGFCSRAVGAALDVSASRQLQYRDAYTVRTPPLQENVGAGAPASMPAL